MREKVFRPGLHVRWTQWTAMDSYEIMHRPGLLPWDIVHDRASNWVISRMSNPNLVGNSGLHSRWEETG